MLDICLLGTGGMMPLPGRWLTSLFCRYNGKGILIDAGEGTQIALKENGISTHGIDIICFTHYHADHISGLPGLLLSIGNADRTEDLTLIGPKGLTKVVNSLRIVAPELPFKINTIEIDKDLFELETYGFKIKAFKVMHKIICYGYVIDIPRLGLFNVEKAKADGIPVKYWNRLQHGETVEEEGCIYTPDMVMGEARKGLKVVYCTDSRPVPVIAEMATDADLFICEGMYGDDSRDNKAKEYKHMTFAEAAYLGKEASPKEMWLTHFSPALVNPRDFLKNATDIYPNIKLGKCGKTKVLKFED